MQQIKNQYQSLIIEKISLDNDISLILNSDPFPPIGPGDETYGWIIVANDNRDFT